MRHCLSAIDSCVKSKITKTVSVLNWTVHWGNIDEYPRRVESVCGFIDRKSWTPELRVHSLHIAVLKYRGCASSCHTATCLTLNHIAASFQGVPRPSPDVGIRPLTTPAGPV